MVDSETSGGPRDRVRCAYARIDEVDRPEAWILLRPLDDVLDEAAKVQARIEAGEKLPLAGTVFAVKDNIDVAGMPTTAACPDFGYRAERTATAVRRLLDAGAVLLGKTNLDQFATGLVGTRSPHGAVRNAWHPELISGGSSSGSAVVVALGIADFALGTDTAGSGRVPAALNGIVGVKPTLGVVPVDGVVPACPSYDCVTAFAPTIATAATVVRTMAGMAEADPASRAWPSTVRLAAPGQPRVAVPRDEDLTPLSEQAKARFLATVARLRERGADIDELDVRPLLDVAKLLYDGALVAERYAAFGEFVEQHPVAVDPSVAGIALGAKGVDGAALVHDQQRLRRVRGQVRTMLAGFDALLLPTAPTHPSIDAVRADPLRLNSFLGTYTNFVNLLDMAAVAVPAGAADGGLFGVSVIVREFDDQVALDIASLLVEPDLVGEVPVLPTPGVRLAVFGAHMSGEPLNPQLVGLGARYVGPCETAPRYRMYALPTSPPKPGVVGVGEGAGVTLTGELWLLPPAGLGTFLAELPAPMTLGKVQLSDGSWVVGFGCADIAGEDISHHGGWRSYLAHGRG
ncbi:allophanate hydrolase [Saccharomonospora marina XMU15]|uniref:Allophanate hydrolase n=1 Tax=Saccharomonospora marina XMU15 TaxID=882083 RepID=H5WYM2_9PSEU|nr:allophanate hydrolase [Saccharomonospora marina XMU15]